MCHLLILGPGRPGWLVPRAVLHQPQLRPEEGGYPGGGGGAAVLALNLQHNQATILSKTLYKRLNKAVSVQNLDIQETIAGSLGVGLLGRVREHTVLRAGS